MNHIQVSIEANEEQQEILISELSELDATGFEQMETHLLAYFNETDFRSDDVKQALKDRVFNITSLPTRNWNAEWESNFQPVVVDDFCAIRADFHAAIKNVQHEIIITPKMSFGTGHHATTYMMMKQMQHIDFDNKTVFDFGTGTGILAILAAKLDAASITAIDNDEWSIKNAEENFERNNVHSVQLYEASQVPAQEFDIILANINRNVLIQYASLLTNNLSHDGKLLVSGLLEEDKGIITETYNALEITNVLQKDKWISILFSR